MGNIGQRWAPLLCKKERGSHRSVTERSFMQNWLDLCLPKDVGLGLDSCGSSYLAALLWGKPRKPNHVRRRPGRITSQCSHTLIYFVWKITFSLNRNDTCCLLQPFLQLSTSPASLHCPLYVCNYIQKVNLAAENVTRVIKTSDKTESYWLWWRFPFRKHLILSAAHLSIRWLESSLCSLSNVYAWVWSLYFPKFVTGLLTNY